MLGPKMPCRFSLHHSREASVVSTEPWKRGMTQRALADAAGVSPSYLAEIEAKRKPGSVEATRRLARALAVPMEHLVPVVAEEAG